jgi:hypothetical protein
MSTQSGNSTSNEQVTLFAATTTPDSATPEHVTVEWSTDGQWQHSASTTQRFRSAIEAMRAVENMYGKQSWHPIGTTTFEGRPLKAQPVS